MDPKTIQNPQNPSLNHSAVTVKVWGERLNSPYNERRKLYVEVTTSNSNLPAWVRDEVDLLQYAVNNINTLTSLFAPSFPNPIPWWLYQKCPHCLINFVNSIKLNLPTNTWRTRLCLRHGLLLNNVLFSIDNKYRIISFSYNDNVVVFVTSTNKYAVTFRIHKDHAESEVSRSDGAVYKFTYRNHVDSYPLSSSYAFLVRRILGFVNSLRDVVRICGVRNIYINGVQVCPPPASDSTDASGGEGEVGVGCGVGEAGGV